MKKKYQRGFTLIELLIAVTIVGILFGLAYPSYMDSVKKSNRSEATATLTDIAQRLQRCYTNYGRFDDANCGVYTALNASTRMKSVGHQYYEISLDAVPSGKTTANAFILRARAISAPQTKDIKGATDCTAFTLDQTGAKWPTDCW